MVSVTYLEMNINELFDVQEMLIWWEGTRFRYNARVYELRPDGWYEGARRAVRFGSVQP